MGSDSPKEEEAQGHRHGARIKPETQWSVLRGLRHVAGRVIEAGRMVVALQEGTSAGLED